MAFLKKGASRAEIINWRFDGMTRRAEDINALCDVQALAKKDQYVRICGESFMPVSLAPTSPLSGYGYAGCVTLQTALKRFDIKDPNEIEERTLEMKGERRLQSWLIREALLNGRSLKHQFENCLPGIEDIRFALDEVSLGDKNHGGAKRSDLLCVALKNGSWLPMVIELKNLRIGNGLADQVDGYAEDLARHREKLEPLLKVITGVQISKGEILKMVIFPEPEKRNSLTEKTYRLFEGKGILLVEYREESGAFILVPAH